MAERLEDATWTPVTGPQHFWLDAYHANILATLKDRVWRGAILLERCRATLMRANHYLFPEGPQPRRIHALVDLFRAPEPIRGVVTRRVVLGANAVFAYMKSQDSARPSSSSSSRSDLRLSGEDMERSRAPAERLISRACKQLIDSNLPVEGRRCLASVIIGFVLYMMCGLEI